ncbi:MAG: TetR/AcrR family transcriptional regulator [Saprospiraceae bacterium]|nr:TetR/AcrR family transcriptional regulator [Saprospiraceae bacterium]
MSPKTKEQFEAIRSQTSTVIKDTALELFAENGFHNTSISQIAKAARVSKGLMYNYFDSKEDLLHDIMMDAMDRGTELMNDHLKEGVDPKDQLLSLVDGVFEWIIGNLSYWKLLAALAFQKDVTSQLKLEILEKSQSYNAIITDLFRQMGKAEPEKEAMLIGALMDGIGMQYMVMPELYPIDEMKELVKKKIIE